MILVGLRRFLVVGKVRIETTRCPWCTDDAVCSACHAKAEEVRERLRGKRGQR